MNQQETEKVVTKPVSMKPSLAESVKKLAGKEQRTFSAMARILIEEGLRQRNHANLALQ